MVDDIKIIPAKLAHVATIARRMRNADRDEVFAVAGLTPGAALRRSLKLSDHAWTVTVNGRPEIMFGVGTINVLTGAGAPWLLGTDAVDRHFVTFARQSVDLCAQLSARYPVLRNVVDARNVTSIRWLGWLGFIFSDPISINGHDFRVFEKRAG